MVYEFCLQELRMYNPEYLERPYIVVLNKIDIPEARDRLPSLTHEILRIGSDDETLQTEISSGYAVQAPSVEGDDANDFSSGISGKVKEIEDYPRPLAVVGASVL
ncbi:hypothetical protein U1Q18_044338 [Sarracenia purpurea var. burkii]